jgi:diguanylate cyclase (GGDEF)-like protein
VAVAAGIRNDDTIGLRLPLGSIANLSELSVTARAAQTRNLVVIRGLDDPALPAETRELMQQAGMRALVALPLVVDTAAVGVLTLCASTPEDIDGQELKLLQELAANLSFALQYVERENAVHFLSNFDALTGLAKRSRFCERLQQRLAHRVGPEARPAVVVLDLERLGLINDSAGRQVGDGLLQGVADRLRRHVDDNDSLAYLGAGTYAAVLPIIGARDSAFAILHERIAALFTAPYEVDGHTIRIVARCGIARYPEDGADSRSLLEHAEAALKTAKAAGERFLPYQLQMQQGHNERLALEQRLHVAIEERQFELHYQPKIDIGSGRLVGVEALLRWQDPTRGLVAPGEFLPVLEATQMIVEVGDWVLEQAVTDLRRWAAAGLSTRIAVNVSPWQLRRHDFANRLLARLGDDTWQGRAGLDLEITETALLQDPDDTLHKLALLRGSGVQIAIDDFGTGYSSLSRLSLLPVDTLKIDRSFTSGLPHAPAALALVSTIIALARAFQLTTVAEGVETPEQLQMLRELGCHQSQGFLHSRPMPFRETTLRLEQERARLPARRDAEPASFRPEATSLRR